MCPPAGTLLFGRVGDWPACVHLAVGKGGTFPKLPVPCPLSSPLEGAREGSRLCGTVALSGQLSLAPHGDTERNCFSETGVIIPLP